MEESTERKDYEWEAELSSILRAGTRVCDPTGSELAGQYILQTEN